MAETQIKQIIKKLRNYEIRIRKAVNDQMHGDFHSVFKGSGIEFDDVREYQYGDDIRNINWNVSAKGHGTFIKTFKEEKEQTVYFLVDVSGSQYIGREGTKKIDIAKEIVGVLALSALREQSQIGLFCFTDRKEKYLKPGKGMLFSYRFISALYKLQPISLRTDISKSLNYLLNLLKRRCVVILVSDFVDDQYEQSLKALGNKHDLVVIHLADRREQKLPMLGIIPVYDRESGRTVWINTSSASFRKSISVGFSKRKQEIETICKKTNSSYLFIDNSQDYVNKLVNLFQVRKFKRSV